MAGEGGSALRARLDGRARTPCDEGLGHLHIAGAGEMIEMGAEIAVCGAGEAFQARKVETLLVRSERGQRGHHPEPNGLVDDIVGSLHRLGPPHPKPAEHEAEAGDESLPENESLTRPEVADEDERSEAEADDGEGRAEP